MVPLPVTAQLVVPLPVPTQPRGPLSMVIVAPSPLVLTSSI